MSDSGKKNIRDPEEKRIRNLTENGQEMFQANKKAHKDKLQKIWNQVEQTVSAVDKPYDLQGMTEIHDALIDVYDKYKTGSHDFMEFLHRANTQESRLEMESQLSIQKAHKMVVDSALSRLKPPSRHSGSRHSSNHSGYSKRSSVIARKRAEVEAAKAKLKYAEQEAIILKKQALLDEQRANVRRQKADLQADLGLIAQQKEAAGAKAELEALELEELEGSQRELSLAEYNVIQVIDTTKRTEQYINSLPHVENLIKETQDATEQIADKQESIHTPQPYKFPNFKPTPRGPLLSTFIESDNHDNNQPPVFTVQQPHINVNSSPFTPFNCEMENKTVDNGAFTGIGQSLTSEFTRFLLKKDLLLTRLTSFNDRPELYTLWKSTFLSIMQELGVTTNEELDLLIKWLGPESSKNAISIRASNHSDPQRGLKRIWERLDERYGSPELIESTLKSKLTNFPKLSNRDHKKLYELADILGEIESTKCNEKYRSSLAYFDSSTGVLPIVNKLPYGIQEKWTNHAVTYKRKHDVTFPPFSVFVEFIRDMSRIKNDPSFFYETTNQYDKTSRTLPRSTTDRSLISTRKTDVSPNSDLNNNSFENKCSFHKTDGHTLNNCRAFKATSINERQKLLKENGICFRCCGTKNHMKRDCKEIIKCSDCGSDRHATAMHIENATHFLPVSNHEGEIEETDADVSSKCTQVCGEGFSGKSCAKTLLVNVYPNGKPEEAIRTYAILDDQSNRSLARSTFFDTFGLNGTSFEYTLSTCSGLTVNSGRRACNFIVESLDGQSKLELPTLIECNQIPDQKDEIATKEVAQSYAHLNDIYGFIPSFEETSSILLLIGRDLPEAYHVLDQRIGHRKSPYAQKLPLGWVIIGETCLVKVHAPEVVNVNKTFVSGTGRESIFKPCPNTFKVMEGTANDHVLNDVDDSFGVTIFERTKEDNETGTSVEDRKFLEIMNKDMRKDKDGHWIAPLPFRSPRSVLQNNRTHALFRARNLDRTLQRDILKKKQFTEFMQGILEQGHAELAPPVGEHEECWYLPVFGVYHPRKKDKVRIVFDSSSKYKGISLNDVLLTGPDLTNNLLGVLIRFRKEPIAITADIQQMFYCFRVTETHRNFLRFIWYKDNDPDQELVDYRMTVHVFGNSPSPAVATFGLRRTAEISEAEFGKDVKDYVVRNFYVDDGLNSQPTISQTIDLMRRTQEALKTNGGLRLHKIASNDVTVMSAFSNDDLAKDLKDIKLEPENLPVQRSLGLCWNLASDTFTFEISTEEKPYTRRGILSVVNSLFDPIGFLAPITVQGKMFLRKLISGTKNWDEPLPIEHRSEWETWRDSLKDLRCLQIPRTYAKEGLSAAVKKELHIFCDASEHVIAAVAYLRTESSSAFTEVKFVIGKAKVSPIHSHTIPRLELCAAVLATELYAIVKNQLDTCIDKVMFYSDSKVVLGYIHNESRRFFKYVSNRVERIRSVSTPDQWTYIRTDLNPADYATRPSQASQIKNSPWLLGPDILTRKDKDEGFSTQDIIPDFPLENTDTDKEIRPLVSVSKTNVNHIAKLGSKRFERFSSWMALVRAMARLKHFLSSVYGSGTFHGWHSCLDCKSVQSFEEAQKFIIRVVQSEVYESELSFLKENSCTSKTSSILTLNPVLDNDGLLRVGGRLAKANINSNEKHPIIIPGKHYLATLIVRYCHELVFHQGRHFTEGAVRSAGFWIVGGKRVISSVIFQCFKCRKLRAKMQIQQMSDLPMERLTPAPPFTFVGMDVFGPWSVVARRTRGGLAHSKCWAVLFTCLTIRAIHIEVITDMSSSSFINALRRFIALRGNVKVFRSDNGTNFVGSTDCLKINVINTEHGPVKDFLLTKGSVWIFNPPHSSHMGGVWERMIGTTRRILDSIMLDTKLKDITLEVISTLMAEVCSIVNARPIVSVSSDPESPEILSPSALLTHKTKSTNDFSDNLDITDMYKAQWKRVQVMAEMFWNKWRREYLQTLQTRRKWQTPTPNISENDIVLLKDKSTHRNEWPVGIVTRVFPSDDKMVRKTEVRIMKDGKQTTYLRPITELVLLQSA